MRSFNFLVALCAFKAAAFLASSNRRKSCSYDRLSSVFLGASYRASLERSLDDMMVNDWRLFRAKLVAKEQVNSLPVEYEYIDKYHDAVPTQREEEQQQHADANKDMVQPQPPLKRRTRLFRAFLSLFRCHRKEISTLPTTNATPNDNNVDDSRQERRKRNLVVLVVEHDEQPGSSIGLVINRPMDGNLGDNSSSKLDVFTKMAFKKSPVAYGGTDAMDEYSVLHGFGKVKGSTKLCQGVFVGCAALLKRVQTGRTDPAQAMFIKERLAWEPEELIRNGIWRTAAVSSDFYFETRWSTH